MKRNINSQAIRQCFIRFGLSVGLGVLLLACSKEEQPEKPPVYGETDRTVLVYMAADNSLNSDGYKNIELMLKGMQEVEGRLVIYFDSRHQPPCLLKIDGGRNCVLDTIEIYPEENSASSEVFARVVEDTRRMFPARSYGLILWSHGMSWLPEHYTFPRSFSVFPKRENMPPTKYFGEDENPGGNGDGAYMEVADLAAAMPDGFRFLIFDACFMSSVEVAYELRNKADYLIASPAEVIADGFPYEQIVPFLWGEEAELKQVCEAFFHYYTTHPSGGSWQSATVALIKTALLKDLVPLVKEILQEKNVFPEVWRYPLSSGKLPDVFFDFGEYIRAMADEQQWTAFNAQLEKTIIYKAATEQFFGGQIPADKYSGMTTYVPLSKWTDMNQYYYTLSWPKAVYWDL